MSTLSKFILVLGVLAVVGLALASVPGIVQASGPTGTHRLNIPWAQFQVGDVLLAHDYSQYANIPPISFYSHSAFYQDALTVFDSEPDHGVGRRPNLVWSNWELVTVMRYAADPTKGPAALAAAQVYNGLPWNPDVRAKWRTDRFYNSQLVWRGYYDLGIDLDGNYTHYQNFDVVTPDDLRYSGLLDTVWDSRTDMTCEEAEWKGQYFANKTLSDKPAYVFCDSAIDFDWQMGPPTPSMPSDQFSIRWTRPLTITTPGDYLFHTRSDDGIRLYLDNVLILNKWYDRSVTEDSVKVNLTVGMHPLRVEYFDDTRLSTAKVWWEYVPPPVCYSVTTAANPVGTGTVGVKPAPNCNGTQYKAGTLVTLTAKSSFGYKLDSWSGDASGATNPLTVKMDGDKSVTANFVVAPPTNLLRNPSFENDSNADNRPDNWTSSPKFLRSTAYVHDGTYSGGLHAADNSGATIQQTVGGIIANKTYRFTGWVNIPATADVFTFKLMAKWRNSAGLIRADTLATFNAATAGWVFVDEMLVPPPGATVANIQMVAKNLNATIYVDDFFFGY